MGSSYKMSSGDDIIRSRKSDDDSDDDSDQPHFKRTKPLKPKIPKIQKRVKIAKEEPVTKFEGKKEYVENSKPHSNLPSSRSPSESEPESSDSDERVKKSKKLRRLAKEKTIKPKTKNRSRVPNSEDEPEYSASDSSDEPKRISKRRKSDKRRKNNLRDYVEMEASEDNSEGEGDIGKENPDYTAKLKEAYLHKSTLNPLEKFNNMNPEDINKHYEELEQGYIDDVDEEETGAFMPSFSDPKIFMVKCRGGLEKEACVSLLRKYYELRNTDNEINIFSASALDKIPCCIFVEAYQEIHVRIACEGLLALNKESIKIIPIKEVRDIFKPDPTKNITLKPNSFVRIKNGLYANDLGLVEDVDPGKAVAIVKLVPRLLGAGEAEVKNYSGQDDSRPQKRLFNKEDYPASEVEIYDATNVNKIVYSYKKREKFENGFIKKRFAIKHLAVNNIHPSYDEVHIFKKAEPDENKWQELIKQLTLANDPSKNMKQTVQKGDTVRVIGGDMIGMTGKAVEILQNSIKVDFEGKMGVNELIEFQVHELEKIFIVGEQIEVIGGQYTGRTGSIVSFEGKQAVFISDDTHEELPVFLTDIRKKTTKITQNTHTNSKINALEKHDLISIDDGKTIGLILSVFSDSVTIIDCENMVSTQSKIRITKKFTKPSVAKNNHNETVQEKCTVKVTMGLNKGTLALVLRVYDNKIFLHDKNRSQNNGVFVENVDNCVVLESHSYDNSRKLAIYNNQAKLNLKKAEQNQAQEHVPPNRGTTMKNNPQATKISLIGQIKRVIKGPYKGYEGTIQSIIENDVRFELSAKNEVIKIPLSWLDVNNAERESLLSANARTPLYKNPMTGSFNPYNTGTPAYKPNY